MNVAVFPLARPTFDTTFALDQAQAALRCIGAEHKLGGSQQLLMDDDALAQALAAVDWQQVELVIILQCSFCDANMALRIASIAAQVSAPVAIWAWPEARTGGRLRLNSFCGANLAAHALKLEGRELSFKYQDPHAATTIAELTQPPAVTYQLRSPQTDASQTAQARAILDALAQNKIGLIGKHPEGFATCAYDAARVQRQFGLDIEAIELPQLFDRARSITPEQRQRLYGEELDKFANLGELDQPEVDKALALHQALEELAQAQGYSGIAVRCWPEVFTDYGCAVCASMAHVADKQITAACEADVYGTITNLLLQQISELSPWLVDVVDIDSSDDTVVLWHCGSAPLTMCSDSPSARATVHSNRRKPLLREFTLKAGTITLARLSQARGQLTMVLGSAEVIEGPASFSGTSGVIKTPIAAERWMHKLIDFGLEHHLSIVYADCRPQLEAVAQALNIQVLDLDD